LYSSQELKSRIARLKLRNSYFSNEKEALLLFRGKKVPTVCLSILPDSRFERPNIIHFLLAKKIEDCISIGAQCSILFLDYTAEMTTNLSGLDIEKIIAKNKQFFLSLIDKELGEKILFQDESSLRKDSTSLEEYYRDFYKLVVNTTIQDLTEDNRNEKNRLSKNKKIRDKSSLGFVKPFLDVLTNQLTKADILITSEHLSFPWSLCNKLTEKVLNKHPPIFLITPTIHSLDGKGLSHLEGNSSLIIYLDDDSDVLTKKIARANYTPLAEIVELFEEKCNLQKIGDMALNERAIDILKMFSRNFLAEMRRTKEFTAVSPDPKTIVISKGKLDNLEKVKVLSEEIRIKILWALAERKSYGKALAEKLHVEPETMYDHLKQLSEAGFVEKCWLDIENKPKILDYKIKNRKIIIEFDLSESA
jgi:DNA-binding transcriptional ArsR family regulator